MIGIPKMHKSTHHTETSSQPTKRLNRCYKLYIVIGNGFLYKTDFSHQCIPVPQRCVHSEEHETVA